MNPMIFSEIAQLTEMGIKSKSKKEKHSCLIRIGRNINLLVGYKVIEDKLLKEKEGKR